jgi:hypothetical protein
VESQIPSEFKVNRSPAAVCLLAIGSAFGADGEKAKVKGMIASRTGETLIVSTSGGKVTVIRIKRVQGRARPKS